jgi:hypothetical protein
MDGWNVAGTALGVHMGGRLLKYGRSNILFQANEHHFTSVAMVVNKLSKIIRLLPRIEAINSFFKA